MRGSFKAVLYVALLIVCICPSSALAASYYLADLGDGAHFTWADQNPATPQIDVYYDFRPTVNGVSNSITPAEEGIVTQAFQLWSGASNLSFSRNESAPTSSIVNVGVGPIDGPWQSVGYGGASFQYNNAGLHTITQGTALLDLENWDLVVGNGNQPGTVDFFTVAAHEIGHTLGLGHTDGLPGMNVMDSVYHGELTQLSSNDVSLIDSLYGAPGGTRPSGAWTALSQPQAQGGGLAAVPEPSSVLLFASGLAGIIAWAARRAV